MEFGERPRELSTFHKATQSTPFLARQSVRCVQYAAHVARHHGAPGRCTPYNGVYRYIGTVQTRLSAGTGMMYTLVTIVFVVERFGRSYDRQRYRELGGYLDPTLNIAGYVNKELKRQQHKKEIVLILQNGDQRLLRRPILRTDLTR